MTLKTTLIGASLIALTACSDTETPDTMTDTATNMATEVKDTVADYVPLTFDTPGQTDEDHLWLEDVEGERALDQVKAWNARSLDRLKADPRYTKMYEDALEIVNSKDKIPYVSYRGGEVHNFWQDEDSVRGIWRRSTLDSYLSDDTQWETVIDFDALAETEGKNWVYKGNSCLAPDYELCIVNLSDGGKDAVVRREFNTRTKTFVEDGFATDESKGTMAWVDAETVLVAVDFGEGSMTDSGYPRTARLLKRGQSIDDAMRLGEATTEDIGYWPGTIEMPDGRREIIVQTSKTFFDYETHWFPRNADGTLGDPVKLPVPTKANLGDMFQGQQLMLLNEDWRGYKTGDLVSFSMEDFMDDGKIDTVNLVVSPDAKSSIGGHGATKSKLLVSLTTDVKGRVEAFDFNDGKWSSTRLDLPENGTASVGYTNDKEDTAFLGAEGYLTPDTLYIVDTSTDQITPEVVKSLPEWFDSSAMVSEQFFVTSPDGTRVPYFVVRQKDAAMDGTNPTLLYGYGGFRIPINPSYSGTRGKLWVENGGVYVVANIRGGLEYGPKWHQAGLKTERQRIYDDFIAVAEDLIAKGITSSDHLGIEGGSNGGLLTGVMVTQRPDLFKAAIIAVPLLDMERYHLLLAGASWVGEYGDPEDEVEGAFLRQISPYHNLKADADYPEVFLITSTKDDRVHPGHARKFAQRMEDQGHDFLYYENIDGGHSAAANLKETANRLALQHTYLMQKLSD